jgi:cbb3-type cytochrome oxidase subunit 1
MIERLPRLLLRETVAAMHPYYVIRAWAALLFLTGAL